MIRRLLALALLIPSLAFADYASTVLADNPKEYYHLGETSGTNAADSGANNNAGTYTGGFTLNQTGIPGYAATNGAVTLNGSTGYVINSLSSDHLPNPNSGEGWSAEAWFYANALADQTFISAGDATHFVFRILGRSTGTFQFITYNDGSCLGGNNGVNDPVGSYTATAWHHVVGTTMGSNGTQLLNQKLYVDGSLVDSTTSFALTGPCTTSYPLNIGRTPQNTFYLAGTVDEVAIYKGTGSAGQLSATRILAHYNAGCCVASTTQGLPFSVKRDRIPRPWNLAPEMPQVKVDLPAFLIERLNKKAVLTPGMYAATQ